MIALENTDETLLQEDLWVQLATTQVPFSAFTRGSPARLRASVSPWRHLCVLSPVLKEGLFPETPVAASVIQSREASEASRHAPCKLVREGASRCSFQVPRLALGDMVYIEVGIDIPRSHLRGSVSLSATLSFMDGSVNLVRLLPLLESLRVLATSYRPWIGPMCCETIRKTRQVASTYLNPVVCSCAARNIIAAPGHVGDHMLDIQIRSQAPIDFEVTDLQFEPSASVEVSKRLRHHMHALDESHPDPAPYTCAVCVRRGRSGAW